MQREFASRSDVKIWISKNQLAKRNLSNWDRCTLALSLEDDYREKARENKELAIEKARKKNPKNVNEQFLANLPKPLSTVDTKKEVNTRAEASIIFFWFIVIVRRLSDGRFICLCYSFRK